MLSIYLLVQKNNTKVENLLLIGYSPQQVSKPYQMLTLGMNAAVLIFAFILLLVCRNYYMGMIELIFPQVHSQTLLPAVLTGLSIFCLVSIINSLAIRRKILKIWYRKD